jgi:hypothetical protein
MGQVVLPGQSPSACISPAALIECSRSHTQSHFHGPRVPAAFSAGAGCNVAARLRANDRLGFDLGSMSGLANLE